MIQLLATWHVIVALLAVLPVVLYFLFGGSKRQRFAGTQSVVPAGASKKAEYHGQEINGTHPRRFKKEAKKLVVANESSNTLAKAFRESVAQYGKNNAIGYRDALGREEIEVEVDGEVKKWQVTKLSAYNYISYAQFGRRVEAFGRGLRKLGLKPGSKLGIYEDTRMEWMLCAQACFQNSIIVVTVYTNLGDQALLHALNEGELPIVMTNGRNVKKLLALLGNKSEKCPSLKGIIYTDSLPGDVKSDSHDLIEFRSIESQSSEAMRHEAGEAVEPKPNELAVIMYTSGSTGNPKGVMLTHHSLCAAVFGFKACAYFDSTDVYIAYLPLAHVLELVAEMTMLACGATVGYAGVRTLVDNPQAVKPHGDLTALRPTLMAGVPTVYDRVKKGALAKVKQGGPLMTWLFNVAYRQKAAAVREGNTTPLWDLIIFNKFKKLLGGRVRRLLSGGAPLSRDTHEFLRVAFSCPVSQGYGLTETCGCTTIMSEDDFGYQRSGPPVPCCEIRLADCPELGYLSTDKVSKEGAPILGRGEIWIRGANVAQGYYHLQDKTDEAFTNPGKPDGWFMTGDIGQWTQDGVLQIIDRVKNLVKMAQGEYIALERLESVAKNSEYVENICVYANSEESYPVALVTPNQSALTALAKEMGISGKIEELCKNKKIENKVLSCITNQMLKEKLKPFELCKNIRLYPIEWTPENGFLSSSNKLKRPFISSHYEDDINAMYKEGPRKVETA